VRETVMGLKFPNRTADHVAGWLQAWPEPALLNAPDVDLRRWLARCRPEHAAAVLELFEAEGYPPTLRARVNAVLAQRPPLAASDLAMKGAAIMEALGIGPSPKVGEATRFLLDAVLREPQLNTDAELRRLLEGWNRQ